jgi:hypothetical protein
MTKTHDLGDKRPDPRGGERAWGPHRPDSERFPAMSVRKVDAATVPYGESVSKNGRVCWAAFHDGEFVCCAATRDECWTKYRDWNIRQSAARAEAKRQGDGG